MKSLSIQKRSFDFAVTVVELCLYLEKDFSLTNVIVKQLLRSGTSVCANAEEASAGQSKADFIHKLSISQKEARETLYWLRLIKATQIFNEERIDSMIQEADELVRMISASVAHTKANMKKVKSYRY